MELKRPITPSRITDNMTVAGLVESFSGCAFGDGRIYEAVDIYR